MTGTVWIETAWNNAAKRSASARSSAWFHTRSLKRSVGRLEQRSSVPFRRSREAAFRARKSATSASGGAKVNGVSPA